MANPIGDLVIGLSMDSSQFSNTIKGINKQVKAAESAMKANLAVVGQAGDKYKTLEARVQGLSNVIGVNQKKVELLRAKYREVSETFGESSDKAISLARQINNAVQRQKGWENQLKSSQTQMVTYNNKLGDLNTRLAEIREETQRNIKATQDSGKIYSSQKAALAGYSKELRTTDKLIEEQKKHIENLAQSFGKNSEQVREAKRELKEYRDRQKEVARNISDVESSLSRFNDRTGQSADNIGQLSRRMSTLSERANGIKDKVGEAGRSITTAFGVAALGAGLGLGYSVKQASDFEQAMQDVKSVMSTEEIDKYGESLSDLATKMGAETKYSAKEAAKGIEELLKAGVSTQDILDGGLKGALDLATAGDLELAESAEVASTALNAFKKDGLSVTNAADLLAGAANASATDVHELRYGLSMVSAVASGVGLSFEDTTDSLALFAQNGLKSSDAGTSLKTMLLNLSPQTKSAAEMMDALGLASNNTQKGWQFLAKNGIKPASESVEDMNEAYKKLAKEQLGAGAKSADVEKRMSTLQTTSGYLSSAFYDQNGKLKDMSQIAGLLQKSMKGLSDEAKQNALKVMFGTDAIRAANILTKEGAKGYDNMAAAVKKTTAAQTAAIKMDSFKGALEQLKGAFNTVATQVGNVLLPSLTKIVKGITKVFSAFSKAPEGFKKFAAIALVVATVLSVVGVAIGATILIIGGLISAFGAITAVLTPVLAGLASIGGIVGLLSTPIVAIVGSLAILGTAFAVLYAKSAPFRKLIREMATMIVTTLKPAISNLVKAVKTEFSSTVHVIKKNSGWIMTAINKVIKVLSPVIKVALRALLFIVKSVFNSVVGVIRGAFGIIRGLVKIFSGLFTGNFRKMWSGIKTLFKSSVLFIWSIINLTFYGKILKGVKGFVVGFKNVLIRMWEVVKNLFVRSIRTIVDSVVKFFSKIQTTTRRYLDLIKSLITRNFDKVKDIARGFKDGLVNTFTALKDKTFDLFGKIIGKFEGLGSKIGSALTKGKDAVKKGAKAIANGLLEGIGKGVNGVGEGINWVFKKLDMDTRVPTWKVPHYAKGTDGHKGGLAVVNDASGSDYQELIQTPDGKAFIPKGRNVALNLPKGTQVLDGKKTKEILPHYASGIGSKIKDAYKKVKGGASDLVSKAKNTGASAFNKVKDWSEEIWDWVSSPDKVKKLLMNIVSQKIGKLPFTDGSTMSTMFSGMVKNFINKAKNFVFNKAEEAGGGADFGNWKPFKGNFNSITNKLGVYDFLYDLGKQIVSKFKSDYPTLYMSDGKRSASKTKAGTVSDHVYGLGLDLARGGIKDGSYYRMAKSLATHPYLKYVIGSNKWNTSRGGSKFVHFPYGGHENHLHLSAKNPKDAKAAGKGGNFGAIGAGVGKWKDVAKRALKMTGDFTPANLKALMARMSKESNGNPRAINLWDKNARRGTPSKGLMQVIGPTFRTYKMKGHGNIWNPLDNILASIRYTKATYGSLRSGWGRVGGYSNGGLVTAHQVAQVAEGNNPEMIIPLQSAKRGRALQLLAKTEKLLGVDKQDKNGNANSNAMSISMLERQDAQISLMQQQIELLTALVAKNNDIYLDGKAIYDSTTKYQARANSIKNIARGI